MEIFDLPDGPDTVRRWQPSHRCWGNLHGRWLKDVDELLEGASDDDRRLLLRHLRGDD